MSFVSSFLQAATRGTRRLKNGPIKDGSLRRYAVAQSVAFSVTYPQLCAM